jgi:hypothetical protein
LADALAELDGSVAGLLGGVLSLRQSAAAHEVLSLASAAAWADSTSVSSAPTSTLMAASVAQVDRAVGRLALGEQLKAEAAPHVLAVPVAVLDP